RFVGLARRVLDRQTGDPGRGGELHVGGDFVRLVGEAALEVRVDGDADGARDPAKVLQCLVAPHAVVGARQRPRVPGARGRERLESHLLERDGGADVPRVRDHEAALGVQPVERLDLRSHRSNYEGFARLPVTSRSRSNSFETKRQARMSITSRTTASATASRTDGVITRNVISAVMPMAGRLARVASCCATRTSRARTDIAIPTQTAQIAISGVKTSCATTCGVCQT